MKRPSTPQARWVALTQAVRRRDRKRSKVKTSAARKRLVRWLLKKHGKDSRAAELASRMRRCTLKKPCDSAACPTCAAAAQARLTLLLIEGTRDVRR